MLIKITNKVSGYTYKYSCLSKGTVTSNHLNCMACSTNTNGSAHSEGIRTISRAKASHAEGFKTLANGSASHAEGEDTTATGYCSHAEGRSTTAIGQGSHAGGWSSIAQTNYSFAHGEGVQTMTTEAQAVFGRYNDTSTAVNTIFMIGNGTPAVGSNAFRVSVNGTVYSRGAYINDGADYAEMFEWSDGNPEKEDRIGYFVTFDKTSSTKDKIRIANSNDKYILGVTSATPCVVGDSYSENWCGKYETDDFGRIQYETVIKYDEVVNEFGETTIVETEEKVPKLSAEYSVSEKYIPREERPEWTTVGFVGKLLVYHDGTIQSGDMCKPNDDGIATLSTDETGYYVMSVTNNVAKILLK